MIWLLLLRHVYRLKAMKIVHVRIIVQSWVFNLKIVGSNPFIAKRDGVIKDLMCVSQSWHVTIKNTATPFPLEYIVDNDVETKTVIKRASEDKRALTQPKQETN